MDPIITGPLMGALAGGLLSGGGSLLGGMFQNKQNQENVQTSFMNNMFGMQQQEAFTEKMANTAYQRSVKDMEAAGLNPILAAGGISGAGGASVGQPSSPTATAQNVVGPAVSSAMQGAKLTTEMDALSAGVKKVQADADLTDKQAQGFNSELAARIGNLKASENANNSAAAVSRAMEQKTRAETESFKDVGPSGNLWDLRTLRALGRDVSAPAKDLVRGLGPLLEGVTDQMSPPSVHAY